MKRLIGLNIAVALAAAFAVLGAAEKTEARTRLSGAGASFPSKIYRHKKRPPQCEGLFIVSNLN